MGGRLATGPCLPVRVKDLWHEASLPRVLSTLSILVSTADCQISHPEEKNSCQERATSTSPASPPASPPAWRNRQLRGSRCRQSRTSEDLKRFRLLEAQQGRRLRRGPSPAST